jgi:hypothetical protein
MYICMYVYVYLYSTHGFHEAYKQPECFLITTNNIDHIEYFLSARFGGQNTPERPRLAAEPFMTSNVQGGVVEVAGGGRGRKAGR